MFFRPASGNATTFPEGEFVESCRVNLLFCWSNPMGSLERGKYVVDGSDHVVQFGFQAEP